MTIKHAALAGLSCAILSSGLSAHANTPPHFAEAADAVVADWTDELGATFRRMAALPEAEFIPAWQGEHDRWRAQLRALDGHVAGSNIAERYEARILYEWGVGRLLYADFHQGLNENPDFQVSTSYDSYLDRLDLTRGDFLDLEEFSSFIIRKRNVDRDIRIAKGWDVLNDGTRNLTAARIANMAFEDKDVRCFLERDALDQHLEDFEADGLTTEPQGIAKTCPGPETDALLARVDAALAERAGHAIEVFKFVDGHRLELHIFQPEEQSDLVAGVVWAHGGGWNTGSWSWCGPCVWFKQRGMVVAQVEYRLFGRHGSQIVDSYADTVDAIAWLREHADDYGIDPERIMVAGFSAGGHLSLSAATFVKSGPARPDLAVSISGCTDLTNDSYSVRLSGGPERAKALSPLLAPNPKAPPMFLANTVNDHLCSFSEAKGFVEAVNAAGGNVTFLPQDGGGHFFLREAERAAETKAAINAFLDSHGF